MRIQIRIFRGAIAIALLAPFWTVSAGLQTPSIDAAPQAARLLDEGRRALEARRFRDAVTGLEQAAALAPSVEAYLLLGRAYWGEDRPYSISAGKAIAALQRGLELDQRLANPQSRSALEQLAVTALRNERLDEARAAYERLLAGERDPARIARFQTQIDEIDLDRGTYQAPFGTTYNARGEVLGPVGPLRMQTNRNFERGRHTTDPVRAEEHFRNAIETDPTMHQAYLNLGQALVSQHRYAAAVPVLEQADRVWRLNNPDRPPYVRALVALVTCHLELGNVERAIEHQQALDSVPGQDNWEVLGALRILIATGRASDAVAPLEAGARADPDNVDVLFALATAYASLARHAEAARQIQEALDAVPPGHAVLAPRVAAWTALKREWLSARTPP